MKRNTYRSVAAALSIALIGSSFSVLAVGVGKGNYVPPNSAAIVSDRLIVKFKANNLPRGLSVAEIHAQLNQPLSATTVAQLQAVAGTGLAELQSTPNGAHVMAVAGQPDRQMLDAAIAGIRRLKNIEYVEEDVIATPQAVPNDSYYTSAVSGGVTYPGLWGLWPVTTVASPAPGGTGSYGADFETAWSSATGNGVVVAVIDTGITANLDIVGITGTVAAGFNSNLASTGYDFITDCRMRASCAASTAAGAAVVAPSPNATDLGNWISAQDKIDNSSWASLTVANSTWHGTHVAGTIAALGNNNKGVIGGAYNSKILPVRVLGKGGGFTSDIANGVLWAAGVHPTISNPNPAKVINMSLGGVSATCPATMQSAINSAVAAGAVVVVAAGNSNADVSGYMPANCANVISVGAIARDGSRAIYSNFSSPASNTTNPINLTLSAQGGDRSGVLTFDPGILSTVDSGLTTSAGTLYNWKQGTSMAAPHVSAAAALMLSKNSNLTPAQLKTILSSTSSLTAFPSFVTGFATWDCSLKQNCGAGILNSKLAVQNSTPAVTAAGTSDFGSIMINGSASQTFTLTNSWLLPAQAGTASITGTNASLFTIGTDTCSGSSIAASGTCQITVTYAPTTQGAHVASLAVPFTGAASSTLASLTGTSLVTLTTADVAAASVTVGQSTTVNLSFNNPNSGAVGVGAISLSQPSIMAASTDNCSNTTLAGGASCSVIVTITPSAVGAYSGTASLSLSAGGAATVSTISGSAAAVPSSSGGGGGCSIMPFGGEPDMSLLFALLALAAYGLGRRITRKQ